MEEDEKGQDKILDFVRVCVCVCACVHMHVHICMCVKKKKRERESSVGESKNKLLTESTAVPF